jgi:hypothetical protein
MAGALKAWAPEITDEVEFRPPPYTSNKSGLQIESRNKNELGGGDLPKFSVSTHSRREGVKTKNKIVCFSNG